MNAKPVYNAVIILASDNLDNGAHSLTVACEDYAEYRDLPRAVRYEGDDYGLTGWNSDQHRAYYRSDARIAFALDSKLENVR